MRSTSGPNVPRGCQSAEATPLAPDPSKLAPFNPTSDEGIAAAIELAGIGIGDMVYDIGCGDGRFLVAAATAGAIAVGIERDAALVARGRARIEEALPGVTTAHGPAPDGGSRIRLVHGDATTTADLAGATVVFVYLVPTGLRIVKPLLEAVVASGGRVVSNIFSVPGWKPSDKRTAKGLPVYLYRSPIELSGSM